jgi:hypothetical protein
MINGKRWHATGSGKVPDAGKKIVAAARMKKTVAALQQALTKPWRPR